MCFFFAGGMTFSCKNLKSLKSLWPRFLDFGGAGGGVSGGGHRWGTRWVMGQSCFDPLQWKQNFHLLEETYINMILICKETSSWVWGFPLIRFSRIPFLLMNALLAGDCCFVAVSDWQICLGRNWFRPRAGCRLLRGIQGLLCHSTLLWLKSICQSLRTNAVSLSIHL
jgi:hypothetical protein